MKAKGYKIGIFFKNYFLDKIKTKIHQAADKEEQIATPEDLTGNKLS